MPAGLADLGGWPAVLGAILDRRDLTAEEAGSAMAEILAGDATSAQISAFIVGLRMKGETVPEISGMVDAMMSASERVELPPGLDAVDTCGTGGAALRRTSAFNVSTIAAFVIAGAGIPVCKHGNRRASGTSGSFDLLEALGVAVELGPAGVARCVAEAGIGACFAPRFHPAMRHAGPVRRELGVPTVFNLLGPLANPAGVRRQVVGVADPHVAERVLGVLRSRGAERAMVVHGHDGLDELTTATTSTVRELVDGETRTFVVDPSELGIDAPGTVAGGDPGVNADLAQRVLGGEPGPHRDLVCLNAAAGIVVGGGGADLAEGYERAHDVIDSGAAAQALERLVAVSQAAADEASADGTG